MSLARWRDATIYLVLIDRFDNGDRSSDDQGHGEFDPRDDEAFHGGDLAGLRRRLPFIKAMGYSALWLTPPFLGQWLNPATQARGYHGYWPRDFTRVDPHFGSLEDYKALVADARRLGIRVIQDVVVNHTGNYFTVDPGCFDPARPEAGWRGHGVGAPDDPVFRMNDPRVPEHKAAGVYNFTPNISDFGDRHQTLTYSLGDLDDLNLENPLVADRMKEIYRFWIEQVGVDGFRVDAAYHTPERFYEGFLHDPDGIKAAAARRGVRDFFAFGEVWTYDHAAINRYLKGGRRRRLDSALDIPLNEALTAVFFESAPTAALRGPLCARRVNRRLWINFLDSHDVQRVAARGSPAQVRQSLVALFTLPGIPCVTYGTEAGLAEPRQDMFVGRSSAPRMPHAPLIRALIRLRRREPALTRGRFRLERVSRSSGLLAYSATAGSRRIFVAFNTAARSVFCELPDGARQVLLRSRRATRTGRACVLEPRGYLIVAGPAARSPSAAQRPPLSLKAPRASRGTASLSLRIRRGIRVQRAWLLVDDDYGGRRALPASRAAGFTLDVSRLGHGPHELRALARLGDGRLVASPSIRAAVRGRFQRIAHAKVPACQRAGLDVKLAPPADPSYRGQLTLESAAVATRGRDLRLEARMARVTDDWRPPHGFDHVCFCVFFSFPGRAGGRALPKLGYRRPGFEFNRGFLLHGWGVRSFDCADSTADAFGAPLPGGVGVDVDRRRRAIAFTFSAELFPRLPSFSGTRVFISTWDTHMGELRAIAPRSEPWRFSPRSARGVAVESIPKVFDHLLLEL